MKRNILKVIPYGFIKSIVITVLLELYLSSFASNFSLLQELIFPVLAAIPFVAVYFFIIRKEKSIKSISLFFLLNLLSFVFGLATITILIILLPHSLIEFREVNNADGLMLILDLSYYIGISLIFELTVSVAIFLKNKGNHNEISLHMADHNQHNNLCRVRYRQEKGD